MQISLIIKKQEPLLKSAEQLVTLLTRFSGAVQIGGIGPFLSFAHTLPAINPEAETGYLVQGKKSPPGRGFAMYVAKGFEAVRLESPLPTATHDLEDMFTFAATLARRLEVDQLENSSGQILPRAALPALFSEVAKMNFEALFKGASSGQPFAVTGVRFPVYLPANLVERMLTMPPEPGEKFFSAYLGEVQSNQYPYLWPQFSGEGQAVEALYRLPAETYHIVPREAFLPVGPLPFKFDKVAQWEIELVGENGLSLGRLAYGSFIKRLLKKEVTDFDTRHLLLRGLDQKRMRQILSGDPVEN